MTGEALHSIPEQADSVLTHTISTTFRLLSAAANAVLAFFPGSVAHVATSLLTSAQHVLEERWEARVAALGLMLPSLLFLAVVASVATAVLWPFAFLVGSVGGLALSAAYLFWPASGELKSAAVSAAFALAAQLLLALPVYCLAPLALFAVLVAASFFLFASRSWLLLAVAGWWLVTTPYWSVVHFVTFPFIFTASILLQVGFVLASLAVVALYPALPSLLQRHYRAFVEQRNLHRGSGGQAVGGYVAATYGHENGHGSSGRSEWVKTEYATSKRRGEEHVKEESKTQQ